MNPTTNKTAQPNVNIRKMLSLYFVAGSQDCPRPTNDRAANLLHVLEQALIAGIRCFQFRDKGANSLESMPEKQRELARQCRDLCRKYQIPFIMNDSLPLALALEADGIHIGQHDMSPSEIRKQCPPPFIIGLSTHSLDEIGYAESLPEVDYCGFGPIFPTQSKANHSPPIGLELIKAVRQAGITKPIVCIGGVKPEHVVYLRQNGADGIAVVSAISQADDVAQVVKLLGKSA